jgi:hypothetical protein
VNDSSNSAAKYNGIYLFNIISPLHFSRGMPRELASQKSAIQPTATNVYFVQYPREVVPCHPSCSQVSLQLQQKPSRLPKGARELMSGAGHYLQRKGRRWHTNSKQLEKASAKFLAKE